MVNILRKILIRDVSEINIHIFRKTEISNNLKRNGKLKMNFYQLLLIRLRDVQIP